jgi:hypothetical protein
MAVLAGIVTVPTILVIPRTRQSPVFNRVLWLATGVLAFLGAWLAPGYVPAEIRAIHWSIADVPLVPTVMGTSAGALSLNVLLWLIDHVDRPISDAEPEEKVDARENSRTD